MLGERQQVVQQRAGFTFLAGQAIRVAECGHRRRYRGEAVHLPKGVDCLRVLPLLRIRETEAELRLGEARVHRERLTVELDRLLVVTLVVRE